MNDRESAGFARPGRLEPGQLITVRYVQDSGKFGTIVARLGAVFGRPAYGQPLGLQLVLENGVVIGIAGVLDAVPERSADRILVLRLTDARLTPHADR